MLFVETSISAAGVCMVGEICKLKRGDLKALPARSCVPAVLSAFSLFFMQSYPWLPAPLWPLPARRANPHDHSHRISRILQIAHSTERSLPPPSPSPLRSRPVDLPSREWNITHKKNVPVISSNPALLNRFSNIIIAAAVKNAITPCPISPNMTANKKGNVMTANSPGLTS